MFTTPALSLAIVGLAPDVVGLGPGLISYVGIETFRRREPASGCSADSRRLPLGRLRPRNLFNKFFVKELQA
jgi:hypothetical protein